MGTGLDTTPVVTEAKPRFGVLWIACLCAGLMIAAAPANATVLLNFSLVASPDDSIFFEVSYPPDPILPPDLPPDIVPPDPIIPVEILSLSLVSTDPAISVLLAGSVEGDSGQMAIVDFDLGGAQPPDDSQPVRFELLFDVASFMDSDPLLVPPGPIVPPTPIIPVSTFDVMFDVLFDGEIAHHMASFNALGDFMFSSIVIGAGSVAVGFDLTGPYTSEADLFGVAITGTVEPIPEPATLTLFVFGLAGLGFIGRRRVKFFRR